MDIGIEIEAMKAGKATLTIQYKTIVKKLDITVKNQLTFNKEKEGDNAHGLSLLHESILVTWIQ